MKVSSLFTVIPLLLLLSFFLCARGAAASSTPSSPDYYESNYNTAQGGGGGGARRHAAAGSWNYVDFSTWPETCHIGKRQSPLSFINVNPADVITDPALRRLVFSPACDFPAENTKMDITNDANVISVVFVPDTAVPGDVSACTVQDPLDKDVVYHFESIHFHAKSEHKFRNLVPDVEMHLVFSTAAASTGSSSGASFNKKDKVLTIAVFLKASSTINSTSVRALRHMLVEGSLPLPGTRTTCFLTEPLPIGSMLPDQASYLAYDGSNTFPPCTENVRWVIMTSPIFISRLALGKLRDAMDETIPNDFHRFGNARPPQALNGRYIYRYNDDASPSSGKGRKKQKEKDSKKKGQGSDDVWAAATPDALQTPIPVQFLVDDVWEDGAADRNSTSSTHDNTTTHNRPVNSQHNATGQQQHRTNTTTDTAASSSAPPLLEDKGSSSSASPDSIVDQQQRVDSSGDASDEDAYADSSSSSSWAATPSSTSTTTEMPTTTTTTTTPTTTTTTTTRAPKEEKKSKGKGKHSSAKGKLGDTAEETMSGKWWSPVRAWLDVSASYIKTHPVRVGAIILGAALAIFVVLAACHRWRKPSIIAGVDPDELRPLTGGGGGGGSGALYGTASMLQPIP